MAPAALAQHGTASQALLDAQLELWHHTFSYIKSMALKSAVDLRVADAIHHHGGRATLTQIVSKVAVDPTKIPCLRRLMRVLTVTGIFTVVQHHPSDGAAAAEPVYALTPVSRLLVGRSQNLAPLTTMILHPTFVSPFFELGAWFERELPDPCLFKQTHGQTLWEMADRDAAFDALFNDGMVSDSQFIMDIVVKECGEVFKGISSLIDVGGGLGAAAHAIAKAFPHVKCSVLDLDHVVAKAPRDTDVMYIPGDMFQSIPPANALFFKWVMHDWGDEECIKILKNCRKSISPRDEGGKVIIMDIVVEAGPSDSKHREVQVLFDLYIMFINGIQRDEQEWKNIFFKAGFSDYKIIPVLGTRSIIEVYP
ncbi:hypothetical protein ACP70R_039633 [Stipagrostis hirtigluma subsp. patula]